MLAAACVNCHCIQPEDILGTGFIPQQHSCLLSSMPSSWRLFVDLISMSNVSVLVIQSVAKCFSADGVVIQSVDKSTE